MDIVVPIKFVPDLVEELEIDASGVALDRRFMRLIPSEQDDHALEQALLLKERYGGTVTVVARPCSRP
jgi:electron transfer flavoprotein beta subunit